MPAERLPPSLREVGTDEPLLSVSSWTVRQGQERRLEQAAAELMNASAGLEGRLSGTILHEAGSPEYHLVHSFSGRSQLEHWLDSRERRAGLEKLEAVAERAGSPQRISGLETWFASRGREVETIKPPPRWKMWLASFLGAYPLVVLFQWQVAPELADVPLLLRAAILPLVLLSVMTYLMMPLVTRLLHRWLYP
jgi:hypothetical protein